MHMETFGLYVNRQAAGSNAAAEQNNMCQHMQPIQLLASPDVDLSAGCVKLQPSTEAAKQHTAICSAPAAMQSAWQHREQESGRVDEPCTLHGVGFKKRKLVQWQQEQEQQQQQHKQSHHEDMQAMPTCTQHRHKLQSMSSLEAAVVDVLQHGLVQSCEEDRQQRQQQQHSGLYASSKHSLAIAYSTAACSSGMHRPHQKPMKPSQRPQSKRTASPGLGGVSLSHKGAPYSSDVAAAHAHEAPAGSDRLPVIRAPCPWPSTGTSLTEQHQEHQEHSASHKLPTWMLTGILPQHAHLLLQSHQQLLQCSTGTAAPIGGFQATLLEPPNGTCNKREAAVMAAAAAAAAAAVYVPAPAAAAAEATTGGVAATDGIQDKNLQYQDHMFQCHTSCQAAEFETGYKQHAYKGQHSVGLAFSADDDQNDSTEGVIATAAAAAAAAATAASGASATVGCAVQPQEGKAKVQTHHILLDQPAAAGAIVAQSLAAQQRQLEAQLLANQANLQFVGSKKRSLDSAANPDRNSNDDSCNSSDSQYYHQAAHGGGSAAAEQRDMLLAGHSSDKARLLQPDAAGAASTAAAIGNVATAACPAGATAGVISATASATAPAVSQPGTDSGHDVTPRLNNAFGESEHTQLMEATVVSRSAPDLSAQATTSRTAAAAATVFAIAQTPFTADIANQQPSVTPLHGGNSNEMLDTKSTQHGSTMLVTCRGLKQAMLADAVSRSQKVLQCLTYIPALTATALPGVVVGSAAPTIGMASATAAVTRAQPPNSILAGSVLLDAVCKPYAANAAAVIEPAPAPPKQQLATMQSAAAATHSQHALAHLQVQQLQYQRSTQQKQQLQMQSLCAVQLTDQQQHLLQLLRRKAFITVGSAAAGTHLEQSLAAPLVTPAAPSYAADAYGTNNGSSSLPQHTMATTLQLGCRRWQRAPVYKVSHSNVVNSQSATPGVTAAAPALYMTFIRAASTTSHGGHNVTASAVPAQSLAASYTDQRVSTQPAPALPLVTLHRSDSAASPGPTMGPAISSHIQPAMQLQHRSSTVVQSGLLNVPHTLTEATRHAAVRPAGVVQGSRRSSTGSSRSPNTLLHRLNQLAKHTQAKDVAN